LVTAGIYLLIRLIHSINNSIFYKILGFRGALTIFIARIRALRESDIKKIIALSTLRQLGIIIIGVRINSPDIVIFHLIVHAFFKALLFIAAGALIHNSNDFQDLRIIGGHRLDLLVSKRVVILTKISLCGLPFFSAFYSKELILEALCSLKFRNFITYLLI